MNEAIEKPKFDGVKWVIIWVILGAGVVANYLFSAVSVSLRLIGWLLGALLVCGIIGQTQKGKKWWLFIEGARNELRKVIWPTRQETIQTTIVVVLMVVISALFLWGVDAILIKCVQFFTGK